MQDVSRERKDARLRHLSINSRFAQDFSYWLSGEKNNDGCQMINEVMNFELGVLSLELLNHTSYIINCLHCKTFAL